MKRLSEYDLIEMEKQAARLLDNPSKDLRARLRRAADGYNEQWDREKIWEEYDFECARLLADLDRLTALLRLVSDL